MAVRLSIIVLAAGIGAFLLAPGLPAPESESANVRLVADAAERSPLYDNAVNGVIGDESFIATFGRKPGPGDSEGLRLRTHVSYVEQLLRERPVDHLSEEQRTARTRNLDRLHDYWTVGVFPRNVVMPDRRTPVFIDEAGRICAVGYLLEQDLGREAAKHINARYRTATIFEIDDPELGAWLSTSGLTLEEAAMIQPAYQPTWFASYTFETEGSTECGVNENPLPLQDGSWPTGVSFSPMTRSAALSCQDGVDDAFGASGFGSEFDSDRTLGFTMTEDHPDTIIEFGLFLHDVHRADTGPTEGRVVYSYDGGTTFHALDPFPIETTPSGTVAFEFFLPPSATEYIIAIEARGGTGGAVYLDFVGARVYISVGAEEAAPAPVTHLLTSAYPNPFNPQARFSLSVAQTQNVNVSVYDALGRRVLNLFEGVMAAGSAHPFALDGRGLATGLLFIRATGETFSASQAVTLVR